MASYCGGRWRSSSSVPNSWCPSRSRLQGVDFEQLFGNIKGSTEPASLVDLVGHLLPDIQQAQSAQHVKPNSGEPPAFVEDTIQPSGEALYKGNLAAKLPSEIRTVISTALNGTEKLRWIAVGFSMMAFVFYSVQQISSNFDKYLRLLFKLVHLVKHLQILSVRVLCHGTEHFNELTHAVVEEAITCCCYMSQQYVFGSPILMIAMDIQGQVARFCVYEPQALFGAVGIDDKIEEVIPCKAKTQ